MLFSSIPFLFYFLPCVLLAYYVTPGRWKNALLCAVSLFFYAWGEPVYVFLMLLSILAGFCFGLLAEHFRNSQCGKVVLGAAAVFHLGLLGYFKYADFFIQNFNAATGLSLSLLQIGLPVGISFYTFQVLSYVVDVYRGEPAQKNPVTLAAYVTMFPQLIAGPIVRYGDVAAQLKDRSINLEKTAAGIRRFIAGLAKKVLLANSLGQLCDIFHSSQDKSVLFYWMYAVAFMLQIYYDFSGYSDMAIGLGKMLGFSFAENFDHPYISRSITEFWRRWHISLGSWFRDYVYIPLGGNRVGRGRWFLNIFIVWMLTGLWHGASWNFVVWGLMFGVLLVLEKLWLLPCLERSKVWGRIYTLLFVMVGFVIFDAADLKEALATLGGMFGIIGHGAFAAPASEAVYYLKSYGIIFILAIVGATPFPARVYSRLQRSKVSVAAGILEPVICAGVFLMITACLVDGSFNPFLYFRF